ncbi:MAG: hypothetical protein ABEJ95_03440 [Candidatus Nanohalobium sp.]
MNADTDLSVLNAANVKRFTEAVIEDSDSEVLEKTDSGWRVKLDGELKQKVGDEEIELVFSPQDRKLGRNQEVVTSDSRFFQQLLEFSSQEFSIAHISLEAENLQTHKPKIFEQASELGEINYSTEIKNFEPETGKKAYIFHFNTDIETKSSFHRQFMNSIAVDDKGDFLPSLARRLETHLLQMTEKGQASMDKPIEKESILRAEESARDKLIEEIKPEIEKAEEEANESAEDRIEEISEKYDQRRKELEKEVKEQEEEIEKWKEKYQKARKDNTRKRYIQNKKEAKEELKELKKSVEQKKEALQEEEMEKIDEVIERNSVDVNVGLKGLTVASYSSGKLTLKVSDRGIETEVEITYVPATDTFRDLNCQKCGKDIMPNSLPLLSEKGDIICSDCGLKCRSCGKTVETKSGTEFDECSICNEEICNGCKQKCGTCGETVCKSHSKKCEQDSKTTCLLCGEACSQCGSFTCDQHLTKGEISEELYCPEHIEECVECGQNIASEKSSYCTSCGSSLCPEDKENCRKCREPVCSKHSDKCVECGDSKDPFCSDHGVNCQVCDRMLCEEHRERPLLEEGFVCSEHIEECKICRQKYSTESLEEGKCPACQNIQQKATVGQEDVDKILKNNSKAKMGENSKIYTVYIPRRLRRGKIIVFDREGKKISERKTSIIEKLGGI